jgi:hypothetical protein
MKFTFARIANLLSRKRSCDPGKRTSVYDREIAVIQKMMKAQKIIPKIRTDFIAPTVRPIFRDPGDSGSGNVKTPRRKGNRRTIFGDSANPSHKADL